MTKYLIVAEEWWGWWWVSERAVGITFGDIHETTKLESFAHNILAIFSRDIHMTSNERARPSEEDFPFLLMSKFKFWWITITSALLFRQIFADELGDEVKWRWWCETWKLYIECLLTYHITQKTLLVHIHEVWKVKKGEPSMFPSQICHPQVTHTINSIMK